MRLTQKLRAAAQRYLDLQARTAHPVGRADKGGRWYPKKTQPCCVGIRSPSRAWPWSLMAHCRTAQHVAYDTGYNVAVLRQAIIRINKETDRAKVNRHNFERPIQRFKKII
jgi:hypothetical protein